MVAVSYNVHACIGRDGRFRPDRIAEVLQSTDADLIGLQEVQDRPFADTRVSDFLAERLAMHLYRGPSLQRGADEFGNVLLSRKPAARVVQHDLSVARREPRGVIEADFQMHGRTLRCFVTHLGLAAAERRQQLVRLLPLLRRDDVDVRILAGDINEWRPRSFTLRSLASIFGNVRSPRTFPSRKPMLALDRLCVAPVSCLDGPRVVKDCQAHTASDHLPLLGEISLWHLPRRARDNVNVNDGL